MKIVSQKYGPMVLELTHPFWQLVSFPSNTPRVDMSGAEGGPIQALTWEPLMTFLGQ